MNNITIECKKIVKSFGTGETKITTLSGVDLVAYENEMIMLMGPSGSGKTTLISIIGGLLKQDSGECLVLGKDINKMSEEEKTKFRSKNFGFMFQAFTLVPTLMAVENVAITLMLGSGFSAQKAEDEASKLLLSMGLDKQRFRKPANLSGGEQQRVAIARACIHHPKIILCDEPTSFLDHVQGQKIMEMLQAIKKENSCTIIVVTHDPRILGFADRILEIEDGIVRASENGGEEYVRFRKNPEDKK